MDRNTRPEDPAGTRRQGALRTATRFGTERITYPVRGRIDGVQFRGTGKNKAAQTLVDVMLYEWGHPLFGVPLAHSKINQTEGEDWTPEDGDLVVVQFFGGDPRDPVVTGYLPRPGNEIEGEAADAPRYHRRRNETTETITKTGSRRVHVAENETLDVVGTGTVTIGGTLQVTVTGDVTITCEAKATVNVTGDALVNGSAKVQVKGATVVEIDGGSTGAVKGIVQGDCICALTGKPHFHISSKSKASIA